MRGALPVAQAVGRSSARGPVLIWATLSAALVVLGCAAWFFYQGKLAEPKLSRCEVPAVAADPDPELPSVSQAPPLEDAAFEEAAKLLETPPEAPPVETSEERTTRLARELYDMMEEEARKAKDVPPTTPSLKDLAKQHEVRPGSPEWEALEDTYGMVDGILGDVDKVKSRAISPEGIPRATDFRFDTDKEAATDPQRMRALTQEYMNMLLELQGKYVKDVEATGCSTLLDAKRLAKDKGLKESRAMVVKLRKVCRESSKECEAAMAEFLKKVEATEFTTLKKEKVVESWRKGLDDALPLYREVWKIDLECADVMDRLLDVIRDSKGAWKEKNNLVLFDKVSDEERFLDLLDEIKLLVKKQQELREKGEAAGREKLERALGE